MIRTLFSHDTAALTALELEAQSGASARSLERALVDEAMLVLGAWQGQALLGYALIARLAFDAELQAIGVARAWRGQGLGRALLEEALAQARAWQRERLLLEVRAGNHAAIRLYEAAGFCVDGRRRGYYPATDTAGREDALLMSHPL